MSVFSSGWWYNSNTGSVIDAATGEGLVASLGIGWHGPFANKQDALNFYSENEAANPGWKAPTGLGGAVTNAVKKVTDAALPTFGLSVSGISGWFIRAMKVVFGGVLILVGIMHLTGTDNKLTQLASKIPVIPV